MSWPLEKKTQGIVEDTKFFEDKIFFSHREQSKNIRILHNSLRSSVLLASSESPLKLTRPSLKLKHWTQNLESTENDLHKNFLLTDVFNFSLFQRGLSREKNKFLRKVLRCYPMKFRKDWREQRRPWEKEIRISDSWDFEMNSHSKGKEVFWFLRDFL